MDCRSTPAAWGNWSQARAAQDREGRYGRAEPACRVSGVRLASRSVVKAEEGSQRPVMDPWPLRLPSCAFCESQLSLPGAGAGLPLPPQTVSVFPGGGGEGAWDPLWASRGPLGHCFLELARTLGFRRPGFGPTAPGCLTLGEFVHFLSLSVLSPRPWEASGRGESVCKVPGATGISDFLP